MEARSPNGKMAGMQTLWSLVLKAAVLVYLMSLLRDDPAMRLVGLAPLSMGAAAAAARLRDRRRR